MRYFTFLCILLIAVLSACSSPASTSQSDIFVESTTEETFESEAVIYTDEAIVVNPQGLSVQATKDIDLRLKAELASPVVEQGGEKITLQATAVDLMGDYAVVSYNVQGETYLGGIDVLRVKDKAKPKLISRAIYTNADVHAVRVANGRVYAVLGALSKTRPQTAFLHIIPMSSKGYPDYKAAELMGLEGNVGTSVATLDDAILATSGDNGGMTVLNSDLEQKAFTPLAKARWVDANDSFIAVLQAIPGQIQVFDAQNFEQVSTLSVDGLTTPQAKSVLELEGKLAFIAAGTAGVEVLNLTTGKSVASISPEALGDAVTNAVTAGGNFVFVAGGTAGLHVAYSDTPFDDLDEAFELTTLGKLELDGLASANHVHLFGDTLFVAAGLEGLKIIQTDTK